MANDPSSVSIWHILLLIISGVTGLLVTLGIWILNSVSKRVSEAKESAVGAHKRIDDLERDRTQKWLSQGKECAEEKAQLREVKTIIKYGHPKEYDK